MTTRHERRDRKRAKRAKAKLMRGNRRIFLRSMLSKKRYHKACTMKGDDDEQVNAGS